LSLGADAPPTTWQVAEAVLVDSAQRGKLLAYARTRFGIPPEDGDDLVQETALELLRHQSHVDNASGFVFAVFRTRCCQYVERQRRGREVFAPEEESRPADAPATLGQDRVDQNLAVRQALKEISPSCRQVLAAYYVEGQSLNETAQGMALAVSGIFKTLNRCLKRLRKCLA
jgi:RNA polymerase sigma factor (sigma-70 family)